MNVEEILLKLNSILNEKINKLKLDLTNLNNFIDIENKIEIFFEKYEDEGIFDIHSYINLCEFFDISYNELSIKNIVNTFEKLQENKELFAFQIEKCKERLNILIDEINKKYEIIKSENKTKQISLEKDIYLCEKIQAFILNNKFSILLDEDNTSLFVNFLNECNLKEEDYAIVIFELIKSNTTFIQREYNLKRDKKKQKTKSNRVSIVEKQNKEKDQDNYLENESNKKIYDNALEIINKYEEKDFNNDIVKVIVSGIRVDMSFDDRLTLYLTSDDTKVQELTLVSDLKNNIIPQLEKTDFTDAELFKTLKLILELYEEILSQKQNSEKDFFTILKELELSKELKSCEIIDEFLFELNRLLMVDYKGFDGSNWETLYSKYEKLKIAYSDYKELVKNYLEQKDSSNKELMDAGYQYLQDVYYEAYSTNEILNNSDEMELMKEADEFYTGDVKNIFVFLDNDDSIISNVEKEINEDPTIGYVGIGNTYTALKSRLDDYNFKNSDHMSQATDYSEEFLYKYKLRAMKQSGSRIFYTRFDTELSSDYGYGEKPHIVFILQTSNGQVSENSKEKSYKEALKKCLYYREKIDYIVELLRTDLSELPSKERLKKEQEIKEYLDKQKLKLGHLIKTYKRIKGGKQNEQK